ncbi:hypothetical protein H4219_004225 [Mycoemilia scoparia]|uniref:O-methyltransferase n=1 Tax=Mycoemilia scoparia TaxID=417184 RepID=A0A9W8DS71_9FUNG|nr:hypothetical protein H4219_004225 [Mycoemilia scoparia]
MTSNDNLVPPPSSRLIATAGGTKIDRERTQASVQEMLEYSTFVSAPKDSVAKTELEKKLAEIHTHGVETYKYLGKILPIYPLQAYLLTWLIGLVDAKNVFEIGTFTGYSTIYLADALRGNGVKAKTGSSNGNVREEENGGLKPVVSCELVKEVAEHAEANFVKAGVDDLIEVRQGKALDTIKSLPKGTKFDFIFIDADKHSYTTYYKAIMDLELLSTKGVLVFDNTMLARTERLVGKEANQIYEFNQSIIDRVQGDFQNELTSAPLKVAAETSIGGNEIGSGGGKKDLTEDEKDFMVNEVNQILHAFNVHVKNDDRVQQLSLPILTGMTVIRLVQSKD